MPSGRDVALARIAGAAYSDNPLGLPTGFTTVAADTLGLSPGAGETYANGIYHNANAAAMLVRGSIDGSPALVLAFRGSDDREDSINSLRSINADYPDFATLIAAFDGLVARAGIRRVVVTGHSLGGAMTQLYMADHPDTAQVHYFSDTFGSPGALIADGPDPRVTNFRVADDPAVFLGENRRAVGAELRADPFLAGIAVFGATQAFPGLTTLDAIASLPSLTQDYENRGQDFVLARANGSTVLSRDLADVATTDPAEHRVETCIDRLTALTNANGDNQVANARKDFNDDGRSDILWRNDSGLIYQWRMAGTGVLGGTGVASLDAGWRFLGAGDFNGDGLPDLLWRNTSGLVYEWRMSGAAVTAGGGVGVLDASWAALAVADFNGDGRDDILWQNTSGLLYDWSLDGFAVIDSSSIGTLDSSWRFLGAGDFDGDGRQDLLWQNTSGLIYEWRMDGAAVAGGGAVTTLDATWRLLAIGDFDGDGKSDLLWQDTGGLIREWRMNGTDSQDGGVVGALDPAQWKFLGSGDYNGDGRTDVLWRNGSGLVYEWQMDGARVVGGGGVATLDASWKLLA